MDIMGFAPLEEYMLSAGTTHLAITPLDVLKVSLSLLFHFFDKF